MTFFNLSSAAAALFWLARTVETSLFNNTSHLRNLSEYDGRRAPKISIIVAARNEEAKIQQAVQAHLSQSYPAFEVIVVDDRSTDHTGGILEDLAKSSSRLRIIHVEHLPKGWLGKTHAQWTGAENASGEWLVFADGDVIYEQTVVSRAVRYAEERKLDHLVILPKMDCRTTFERVFMAGLTVIFCVLYRPWKMKDPKSRETFGTGAFQLIRRDAYEQVGTHKALALEVIDDVGLAKAVKKSGFKQDCLIGDDMIQVRWQEGIWGIVKGLEKNLFSFYKFNVGFLLLGVLIALAGNTLPFLGVILSHGIWRILSLLGVGAIAFLYFLNRSESVPGAWASLFHPIIVITLMFAALRSAMLALRRGGILWRDTFYPMDALRLQLRHH